MIHKVLLIAIAIILTSNVFAQDMRTPEGRAQYAVEVRQSAFKLLGYNMAPLGAMARGKIPIDAEQVKLNSERIAVLSQMIPDLFVKDTREFTLTSDALSVIWTDTKTFNKKAKALSKAANRAVKSAASGNDKKIKQAIGKIGAACGSCHDDFTAE